MKVAEIDCTGKGLGTCGDVHILLKGLRWFRYCGFDPMVRVVDSMINKMIAWEDDF